MHKNVKEKSVDKIHRLGNENNPQKGLSQTSQCMQTGADLEFSRGKGGGGRVLGGVGVGWGGGVWCGFSKNIRNF